MMDFTTTPARYLQLKQHHYQSYDNGLFEHRHIEAPLTRYDYHAHPRPQTNLHRRLSHHASSSSSNYPELAHLIIKRLAIKYGNDKYGDIVNQQWQKSRSRTLVNIRYQRNQSTDGKSTLKAPSVFYTNWQSLSDEKTDDLKLRLNDNKSDIVCLTETWFTDAWEKETQFTGYKLFTIKWQNRVGGGVAILVNSQIHTTILESQSTKTWFTLWLIW